MNFKSQVQIRVKPSRLKIRFKSTSHSWSLRPKQASSSDESRLSFWSKSRSSMNDSGIHDKSKSEFLFQPWGPQLSSELQISLDQDGIRLTSPKRYLVSNTPSFISSFSPLFCLLGTAVLSVRTTQHHYEKMLPLVHTFYADDVLMINRKKLQLLLTSCVVFCVYVSIFKNGIDNSDPEGKCV